MSGFDIIGDIHGHASKLEERLLGLGYAVDPGTGAYRHTDRRAVFVGDLIDRGPEQLRVLEIVKAMVDSGSARIVMGNHEFNAIAYATEDPGRPGEHRRPHSEKNKAQHRAFLEQLTEAQRTYYTDWFMTLPLWLELDGVRVVHACWHEPSREVVRAALGGERFTTVEQIISATDKESPLYEAVEVLLKGPEVSLVDYGLPAYRDKDGHRREKARARWWHHGATTLAELAEVRGFQTEDGKPYPPLPDVEVDSEDRSYVYKTPCRCSTATTGGRTALCTLMTGPTTRRASTSAPARAALWWPTAGTGRRPSRWNATCRTARTSSPRPPPTEHRRPTSSFWWSINPQ